MARMLFLPNYLGGGFGHTGRCLALAESWRRRGGEAAFVLAGPHAGRVAREGFPVYPVRTPALRPEGGNAPAYVYVPEMSYQIVRDGFDHPAVVRRALKEAAGVVAAFRPDVLVGDGWPVAHMLACRVGLPLVQIAKSVAHPDPERLVWWEEAPAGLTPPDPLPVINPVRAELGMKPISRAEELLDGDLFLIPGIPPLDPVSKLPARMHYVGPILRGVAGPVPEWMGHLGRERPVVYVTIGGAAGRGPQELCRLVAQALGGRGYDVVVSLGGKGDAAALGEMPANVHIVEWAPTSHMLARTQAVVLHGGYTRMEVLKQGLPSVVIPFHSEQEYYGRLMTRQGVAIVAPYSEEPYTRIECRWRGGSFLAWKRFTVHVRVRPTLTAEGLRQAVERALFDTQMLARAQELRAALEGYGGCDEALNLIESELL